MFGWRARIGYVSAAGAQTNTEDNAKVLPEGVVFVYTTIGVRKVVPSEFERVFEKFLEGAQIVAGYNVQYIMLCGSAVMDYQYKKALDLAKRAQEITGIPTALNTTMHIKALKDVGAKKVVVVSPFVRERNKDREKILEDEGMKVVNSKGLGLENINDISCVPPYAAYRLAMDAIRETPEADTINIICPVWEVLGTTELLERDSGKVVVSAQAAQIYTALKELQIRGPIHGYGKLLEVL